MRMFLLNIVDLKTEVFLHFAYLKLFHNFSFLLCTYRFSYSQVSVFGVGHFPDPGISLERLLRRPPSAYTLAQLAPHFQHRIQLKLHVFNQQFQPTFLTDTYLPEEGFFFSCSTLPSNQLFFIAVNFKTLCHSESHYHPRSDFISLGFFSRVAHVFLEEGSS